MSLSSRRGISTVSLSVSRCESLTNMNMYMFCGPTLLSAPDLSRKTMLSIFCLALDISITLKKLLYLLVASLTTKTHSQCF